MAGIREDDIRELRDRADLVQIVSEHLSLKKAGRTFRGLCPFHGEKTPSFHVDPAKQLFHCFGCGAGGDVFTFLMKIEGLDFRETALFLAHRTGYRLELDESPKDGAKIRLYKTCHAAMAFYRQSLQAEVGTPARRYLVKRGLEHLTEPFKLGFSPDWSAVIHALKKAGFSEEEIIKSGVGARSQRGTTYDRFRGRLIFPIFDSRGRTVAFGGRVLDDSLPKYLNSPETALYHKGSTLYGLDQAKTALMQTDTAIVVEGYTDLLALVGAGTENTVATLGTAFTEDHLKLLSRFCARIIFVFDGDTAGLNAAERSSVFVNRQRLSGYENIRDLIDRPETQLLVAVLPSGLDPADFIKERGITEFAEALESARPLVNFVIDRIIDKYLAKKAGKPAAATAAVRFIARLESPVAQEDSLRYLGDKLELSYEVLVREIKEQKASKNSRPVTINQKSPQTVEREFLKLVLRAPDRVAALDDVGLEQWEDPLLRKLGTVLKSIPAGKGISINDVLNDLEEELQSLVTELALERGEGDSEEHFAGVYLRLKEMAVEKQITALKKKLVMTDRRQKEYNQIFEDLLALEYKRRDFKNGATHGGSLWVKN